MAAAATSADDKPSFQRSPSIPDRESREPLVERPDQPGWRLPGGSLLLCGALLTFSLAGVGCASTASAPTAKEILPGQSLPDEVARQKVELYDDEPFFKRTMSKTKLGLQKLFGVEPNEAIARKHFGAGEALFEQKDFDAAAKRFRKASKRWPDSALEEDAMFMMAESWFFAERYPKASDSYMNMMKKYENSRYLDTSVSRQFAIGRYWEESDRVKHKPLMIPNLFDKTKPLFDTQGNALAALESVHLNDPTGPLADDALVCVANAHFLDERYEDADFNYNLIRAHYPQSEHQRVAHLLGLRAKMRKYQGPYYDGKPLDQSEELIRQISVRFPDEVPDEQARLRNASRVIHAQHAQRDYETAEYYARTRHYGGARYYYKQVIENYPDTHYAELSRKRIDQYQGRPDNPPNRFKWLVQLFRMGRDNNN
ncbi:MAG: outer membrane protein assembly factor BamD [Pirellulales bacterium]|nr:outer membrane protein assembly factor BamD [Pirellulales bacterium]